MVSLTVGTDPTSTSASPPVMTRRSSFVPLESALKRDNFVMVFATVQTPPMNQKDALLSRLQGHQLSFDDIIFDRTFSNDMERKHATTFLLPCTNITHP